MTNWRYQQPWTEVVVCRWTAEARKMGPRPAIRELPNLSQMPFHATEDALSPPAKHRPGFPAQILREQLRRFNALLPRQMTQRREAPHGTPAEERAPAPADLHAPHDHACHEPGQEGCRHEPAL